MNRFRQPGGPIRSNTPGYGRHNRDESANGTNWRRHNNKQNDWRHKERDGGEGNQERRRNDGWCHSEQSRSRRVEDNSHPRESRPMGYKILQELSESDDIEKIVLTLNDSRKGFRLLLDSDMSPDMIVLALKVLTNICDYSFKSVMIPLFRSAIESSFPQTVVSFITNIPLQTNSEKRRSSYFWKDIDEFWSNIIKTCKHLNDVMPSTSCECTLKIIKAVKLNISNIESSHSLHISDKIKKEVNDLHNVIELTIKDVERKKEVGVTIPHNEYGDPPDDFRDINIYPTSGEIVVDASPFLRPNVVIGPYEDVDHYLDIQYRLLREDFVRPLRKGICRYIENPKVKLDDIRIYQYVQFLNAETVSDQNSYRVQFDFSKKTREVKYENSKRFMYGALLCFTDNRQKFKSIFFGKVEKRDDGDLSKGQLIVGFNMSVELPKDLYTIPFLMVESKVYFDPYYHVLNALKNTETRNFPMERYIIKVDTTTRPPDYLVKINPVLYEIQGRKCCPLFLHCNRFYGLNDAQNVAFQAALSTEFVVIQGPPGTGKTFLGLKIAQTLLQNSMAWYARSPMLVISYTNHALDQFLEGLLPFTDKLIRVGSQSKNQKLNDYNLRNGKNRRRLVPAVAQKRFEVRQGMEQIKTINDILNKIEKYDSVIAEVFKETDVGSWFRNAENDDIKNWLLRGDQIRRYNRTNVPQHVAPEIEEENLFDAALENGFDVQENIDVVADDLFEDLKVQRLCPLLNIESLNKDIIGKRKYLSILQGDDQLRHWEKQQKIRTVSTEINLLENDLFYLQDRLMEGKRNTYRHPPEYVDTNNPYYMSHDDRWHYYFYRLYLYQQALIKKKETSSILFREMHRQYSELRDIEDTQVIKEAKVVGMTTSAAARLNYSLQAIKNPVVIVEEAAEVLEAHIITALTSHCRHLILIGDHQQLKPSAASYLIEQTYKLNISLFQRMVDNKIQCHTLNTQHRMIPEIANLVRPTIYPILHDHPSVLKRPPIMGVVKNLYFIDHQHEEEQCVDSSKKNVHEAHFLIQLARHLILNGYEPENVVILAAYLGQMFEIQRSKRKESVLLQDVRVAVLDNYQGEESDIVLLSLVRNNKENKIGFLKIENRVCVALSRARNGFYIMGNMDLLCANSKIWPKVRKTLEEQNALGPYLSLRCVIHRDQVTKVQTANDFFKIPEGGCELMCETQLHCGHICKRLCHIQDREHALYKCAEKCTKLLCDDNTHVCKKNCYEECGPCIYPVQRDLPCGHSVRIQCHNDPATYKCLVSVHVKLPCNHEAEKPCYIDVEKFICPFPCDVRVEPCGHACDRTCHIAVDPDHLQYDCKKQCERPSNGCLNTEPHICSRFCYQDCADCIVPIKKKRTKCDHWYTVACMANPDDIACEKPCKKRLPCSHKCSNPCQEQCGPCLVKVEKKVPDCDHVVKIVCAQTPSKKHCNGKCPRLLACNHVCGKKCSEECRTRCKELVDCNLQSPCGHTITKISCYAKNNHKPEDLLLYCNHKCNFRLQCEHICSGTCGECFQGRYHKKCSNRCGVILVCNHECQIPCRDGCKPCGRKCEYRCEHSRCSKLCGVPCTGCTEACPRKCRHQHCKKTCGDLCDKPPCSKPCEKKLKCGHECVGFCGDPCPKLCRECDTDELTDFLFGTEDEPDARFVLLVDCGHILESTGMEYWLKTDEDQIKPKVCPRCKTVIRQTHRYSDYVKRNMEDILKVKEQFYGRSEEIKNTKLQIEIDITRLESYYYSRDRELQPPSEPLSAWDQLRRRLSDAANGKRQLTIKPPSELLPLLDKFRRRISDTANGKRQHTNKMDLAAIRAKIDLLKMVTDVVKSSNLPTTRITLNTEGKLKKRIDFILNILSKSVDSISKQESDDIILEIDRLNRWAQLERITYDRARTTEITNEIDEATRLLELPTRYEKSVDESVKSHLEKLKKLLASNVPLSYAERKEIVRAMGFKQGHWYKCPNGHPYCIADCGGATVISKCNECGAPIGGRNHALLPSNAVATEMDGARIGAWSEQANMGNYRF